MGIADFEVVDARFASCFSRSAELEKLWTGARWNEGPAYFAALRSLVWSDIPNDRLLRWDETTGLTGVLREGDDAYANGNTVDRQGRLVSCEHGSRSVVRTEHDGSRTVLASHWNGKRLNSPNDLVVKSDNSVWFTDPSYGIQSDYEGFKADSEIGTESVYRIDTDGSVTMVTDALPRPNGLAFSADESILYIVDSAGPAHGGRKAIHRFDVAPDNSLTGGDLLAESTQGTFDGFRLDTAGNIWTSAGDGVHCLDPDGTLLGKIYVPEVVSNVCFGGLKRNRLFITATTSVYSMMLPVNGVATFS